MMYSSNWNLLWTGWVKPETVKEATKFQRINHFPGTMQIGRKDNMWRNVSRLRRIHNADFDICPQTYVLPEDYKRFQADREGDSGKGLWILKPSALSCGRGIKIVSKKSNVSKKK